MQTNKRTSTVSLTLVLASVAASLAYGQNQLLNGGFEEKDVSGNAVGSHWVLYNGAEVWAKLPNQTPVTVYDGSYSLAFKALLGVPAVGAYQVISTSPGAEWSLSGWALNSEHNKLGQACYGLAQLDFLRADGSVTGSVESGRFAQVTGDWTPFSITGTAPGDTSSVRVGVLLHQNANPSGVLFVDGLQATVAPVPEVGLTGWVALGLTGFAAARREYKRRRRG